MLGSTLYQLMDQLQPKTGNTMECFIIIICVILLTLCLPNVIYYSYLDTGSGQLYAKYEIGVVSVVWYHIVLDKGEAMAKNGVSLRFFYSYMCS